MSTVLYTASVTPLYDSRMFDAAYSAVSDIRRRKTDKCRQLDDKCLSLGAELLLRRALCDRDHAFSAEFVYGENGKPYLKDGGVYFNLSHSHEYVLCAVSGSEVGCDIEQLKKANLKLAARFFTDSEYRYIKDLSTEAERRDAFYRIWTLKESYMKATGLGMRMPLSSFEVIPDVTNELNGHHFAEFEIPGYRCAVCTSGETGDVRLITVNISECI